MQYAIRLLLASALASMGLCVLGAQRPLYEASVEYGPPGAFAYGGSPPPALNWIGVQYGSAVYYVKDLVEGQPVEEFRELEWVGFDWAMSQYSQSYNNVSPHDYNGWAQRQEDYFTVHFHNPFLRLKALVEVRYWVYTRVEAGGTSVWNNTSGYAYSKFRWTSEGTQLDVREAEISIASNEMANAESTTGSWIRVKTQEAWIVQPIAASSDTFPVLAMKGTYIANTHTSSGTYNGSAVRVSTSASSSGKARVTVAIISVETAT